MNVRQIIPADGWFGVLAGHAPGEEPEYELVRVAAWALVEDESREQYLRGISAVGGRPYIGFVDEAAYMKSDRFSWLEYVHADDLNEETREHLQERAKYHADRVKRRLGEEDS